MAPLPAPHSLLMNRPFKYIFQNANANFICWLFASILLRQEHLIISPLCGGGGSTGARTTCYRITMGGGLVNDTTPGRHM